jgi:hypothetical protein
MSQTETRPHPAVDFLNVVPAMLMMQKEFLHTAQSANRDWLARVQSEATLVSDFVSKLSASRSMPEATSICHECIARQFEMLSEDGQRVWTDSQRLVQTGMRFFVPSS